MGDDNCHVFFLLPIPFIAKACVADAAICHVAATAMRISRTFLVPIEPVPVFLLIHHFDVYRRLSRCC